ncbi:hypothetical protein [Demequina capsici]|uniref:Uncharacterized protein n=1 Tax=Demequina capsici TaxID=3075620 RepID=A0AA96J7Q5_9MICO|nr:hypothetical protein [Demequina sp. OYTSA14]WNM24600.1 hypothetical protein RN606_00170 [Demequina sp. OYTSA14]
MIAVACGLVEGVLLLTARANDHAAWVGAGAVVFVAAAIMGTLHDTLIRTQHPTP